MRELKVYLKSRLAKAYFYTQAVVGLILIGNSLRLFEVGGNDVVSSLISIAGGLVLIAAIAIPVHLRRNLRYLPGILIAAGGLLLVWNTSLNSNISLSRLTQPMIYLGYGILFMGIVQPLVDIKQYAYFGASGIKYKVQAFSEVKILWNEVDNIDYNEDSFDIIFKSGKTLTITPLYAKSINLRVHVDHLWHKSKSKKDQAGLETPVSGKPLPSNG